jgi:hypothetical protein
MYSLLADLLGTSSRLRVTARFHLDFEVRFQMLDYDTLNQVAAPTLPGSLPLAFWNGIR